jgi:hypothetical protein
MSRRPIDLSPDLLRLQNEGYDIAIRHGFLLVRDVPYVPDFKTKLVGRQGEQTR